MGLLDDAIKEHLDLKRRRGADPAEIEKAEREALGPVRREAISGAALSDPQPQPAVRPDAPIGASEEFDFDAEPAMAAEDPTTVSPPPPAIDEIESDSTPGGIAAPGYEHPDFDEFALPAADDDELPSSRPIAAMPDFGHKPKRRGLFHRRSHDSDDDFDEHTPLPAELPDDDPFSDEPGDAAPHQTDNSETVGHAEPIEPDNPSADPPARRPPPALQITPDAELGHTVEYDVEKAFAEEDHTDEDILEETPEFLADTPDHDRLWFEQKPPPDFDFDR